jgi:hypothetical protein
MSLPTVVVYSDDPDAFVDREITSAAGDDLTFTPMLSVGPGGFTRTGTWQGAVSSKRVLRIPCTELAPGPHHMYLSVPGGNDIDLGYVNVVVRSQDGAVYVPPEVTYVTTEELEAALDGLGGGGGGAVTSVNGDVGVVVLDAADVGAATPASVVAAQAAAVQRANHTGSQAISTVTGLQTALDGLAPIRAAINTQTGTTYTIALADENQLVTLTNAGAITVTLPQDSAVAFPVGGRVDFAVLGAGMATFVAGAGATANGTPSLVSRAQYSAASAFKVAANTWLVVGDLA